MRNITREAVDAFLSGREWKKDNTEVKVEVRKGRRSKVTMLLHGNAIAVTGQFDSHPGLRISTAGWDTNTTRERLNGLPHVYVYRKKGQLHLNGKPWDGDWVTA